MWCRQTQARHPNSRKCETDAVSQFPTPENPRAFVGAKNKCCQYQFRIRKKKKFGMSGQMSIRSELTTAFHQGKQVSASAASEEP